MRLLSLLLLVVAVPLHVAVELPPANEKWTRLDAGDIVIYSNARDGAVRQAAADFQRMRAALSKVTRLEVVSPVPTKIFLFRSHASFVPYRDALAGPYEAVRGIFAGGDDANYAVIDGSSDPDRVVYHELTHFLVRNTVAGIPRWLDEGLAEFYSTFVAVGSSVRLGKPPDDYLPYLRDHGLDPLRKLLTMTLKASDYKNENLAGIYYAESWLLVHYLLIGNPARGAQLPLLLSALSEGRPLDEAFHAAFKATPEEVEGELRRYLNGSRFKYIEYAVADPGVKEVGSPQPLARDELLFQLGDLLVHTTKADGESFLRASLELKPDRASTLADLAAVAESSGQIDLADTLYDKAIKTRPDEAIPYLYYGSSLVSRLQAKARDGEEVSGVSIALARGLATKCVALAPRLARCLALLGATYTFSGEDPAIGISQSAKSFGAAPGQLDVAADLVLLYAKMGKPLAAEAMIDRAIAPSADESRIAAARENLVVADYQRGIELSRRSRGREAITALESVVAHTTNARLKAQASAALVKVRAE